MKPQLINEVSKGILIPIILLAISLSSFTIVVNIPITNKKVIDYCDLNMKKQVARGECWDLARYALDYANADWKPLHNFGKKVNYKTKQIFPGDIIQFEKVKIEYENGYKINMGHHTAIVYKVNGKGKYTLVHQNFDGVRKVRTDEIDLNYLTKGKVTFFRPQAK